MKKQRGKFHNLPRVGYGRRSLMNYARYCHINYGLFGELRYLSRYNYSTDYYNFIFYKKKYKIKYKKMTLAQSISKHLLSNVNNNPNDDLSYFKLLQTVRLRKGGFTFKLAGIVYNFPPRFRFEDFRALMRLVDDPAAFEERFDYLVLPRK
jgi:hypothetical protein